MKKAEAEAKLAMDEVQMLEAEAGNAPEDQRAAVGQRLEAAKVRQQNTAAAVTAAVQKHKAAVELAAPRDTVDIIVTEPIAVKVVAGEAK